MERGIFGFEITAASRLVDSPSNVERLRNLWLDRTMIAGDDLGEGDPGDFDHGAWHLACHLLAAGGVLQSRDGRILWLEISHFGQDDRYHTTITTIEGDATKTWPIASSPGQTLLQGASVLGFIEGNSLGRTSAREVNDPPTRFNLWRRQDFDRPIDHPEDGGRVWEHWCTTRDVRPSCAIGTSVLAAYVSLVAALGDLFPALVARGRTDYAHPRQLSAMVEAGFVGESAALSEITPTPIPSAVERLLLEATPASALDAAQRLNWDEPPRYYMYPRRIDRWCSPTIVQQELRQFRSRREG